MALILPEEPKSTAAISRENMLCWQHLQVKLPRTWDPIRIDGDFTAGTIEFVDDRGPTLGLRWSTPSPRRFDPETAVRRAMVFEVGRLAAAEAKPVTSTAGDWDNALLYEEPGLPGRDVWSAFSPVTGRLVQMIYFANRRDSVLRDRLLPTLVDHEAGRATPWSIFDLNLIAPADARLIGHRLNAGDLALQFTGPVDQWSVRQLAPASLAMARQTLEKWVSTPPPPMGPAHRPIGRFYRRDEASTAAVTGWISSRWRRRNRYFWRPGVHAARVTLGRVDSDRDRLVLLEGVDEALLVEISRSIGKIPR